LPAVLRVAARLVVYWFLVFCVLNPFPVLTSRWQAHARTVAPLLCDPDAGHCPLVVAWQQQGVDHCCAVMTVERLSVGAAARSCTPFRAPETLSSQCRLPAIHKLRLRSPTWVTPLKGCTAVACLQLSASRKPWHAPDTGMVIRTVHQSQELLRFSLPLSQIEKY
jgi:hypothetical protein